MEPGGKGTPHRIYHLVDISGLLPEPAHLQKMPSHRPVTGNTLTPYWCLRK
jgi:hypothetical protein